jgi:hypothetical protein
MQSLVFLFLALLAVLLAVVGFFAIFVVASAIYYHTLLRRSLERDLGFRHGSASIQSPGFQGYENSVAIISVTDGGVFQKAGFRAGDVLPEESFIGLFRLLHRHRGRIVELVVADGGDGEPFKARPRRTIRFFVPARTSA